MKVMALGGIDHIGSSCYYLSLAGQKFLLDCGKGGYGSKICNPDFDALLRTELFSLSELDGIFISHGHYDHVGGLTLLREQRCDAPVYATGLTTALMDALLVDKLVYQTKETLWQQICRSIRNEQVNRSIQGGSYYKPIQKGEVTVTFYPAGHIPGAAMIYFESPEGNVLYTGDFQKDGSDLTEGYYLPDRVRPNVVILCGTHAKHPNHIAVNSLEQDEENIRRYLKQGISVHLQVSQLTKGLETAHWIGARMPGVKLYLDDHTWNLAQRMEQAGKSSIRPNFYQESKNPPPYAITIAGRPARENQIGLRVNFSLHASHTDCTDLIRRLNPDVVFLVHAPEDTRGGNGMGEFLRGAGENICVIQPERGHLYDTAS